MHSCFKILSTEVRIAIDSKLYPKLLLQSHKPAIQFPFLLEGKDMKAFKGVSSSTAWWLPEIWETNKNCLAGLLFCPECKATELPSLDTTLPNTILTIKAYFITQRGYSVLSLNRVNIALLSHFRLPRFRCADWTPCLVS